MKQQFVYPAILYFDEDNNNYALAFHDLDIFTEGDTVEDAFKSAKEFLFAYLKCSLHVNSDVENATSYIVVKNKHESEIVLLIDSEVDEEKEEGIFVDDIFDD
ncbi:MAG: hypothetical protein E7359_00165 [Clostridiales bacterium]|nr:hypothetical protein [Clostridiales bacterium]